MSLKPDLFTFMFFVSTKEVNMLNSVREFINSVADFHSSKIVMSPRKISIQNDAFYFGFHGGKDFTMGFTCGHENILFLNNILNEISTKISSNTKSIETLGIDFFSTAQFLIKNVTDPFEEMLKTDKIRNLLNENWSISPKKLEFGCSNYKLKNKTLNISLEKKDEGNIMQLYLYHDNINEFSKDAAKKAADEITEFANRILQELK